MEKIGRSTLIVLFKTSSKDCSFKVEEKNKLHFPTFLGRYKYCISVQYIRLVVAKLLWPPQALSQSIKSHVFRRNLHVNGNQRPLGIAQMIPDQAKMHHL